MAERIFLHARNVIVSPNQGKDFIRSRVLKKDGTEATGMMKPVADRVDPQLIYGFGDKGEVYVSRDGGLTFHEKTSPDEFKGINYGLVDCADRTEIRAAGGERGILYVATGEGLWKLMYDEKGVRFSVYQSVRVFKNNRLVKVDYDIVGLKDVEFSQNRIEKFFGVGNIKFSGAVYFEARRFHE